MGAGRYTGGLWVGSYVKIATHQWVEAEALKPIAPPAIRQSASEGLDGHRRAAQWRVDRDGVEREFGGPPVPVAADDA